MKNSEYFQPTKLVMGNGKISEIGKISCQFGTRCMLVTGKSQPQVYQNVMESLKKEGIEVFHFDEVYPDPTVDQVDKAVRIAKQNNVQFLIAIGGGSCIDTAKAIAVGKNHSHPIWEYTLFGSQKITEEVLPVIAVPTTSGSGSHVSRVSVISNDWKKMKSSIWTEKIFPIVAVLDPELTYSMTRKITTTTGFDAFTHAFEAYVHPKAGVYSDLMAVEAMRRCIEWLPKLVDDEDCLQGRSEMMIADTFAGLAMSNAGILMPHGLSVAIGSYRHVSHGIGLAIVYPEFIEFTYRSDIKKFAYVARMFDHTLSNVEDAIAAAQLKSKIEKFIQKLELNFRLSEFGVTGEDIPLIAEYAVKLVGCKNNPVVPTVEDVCKILMQKF